MDLLTRTGIAIGVGLCAGAGMPGDLFDWGLLTAGLFLLALPRRGLLGLRGLLLCVSVGICCARSLPEGPALSGPVRIVGARVSGASGRSGDVEIARLWRPEGGWQPGSGRVRVIFPSDAPGPGSLVLLLGAAGPVKRDLPGAPDPVYIARMAGVRTVVKAERAEVIGGRPRPLIGAEKDPTCLMRAIVLGDRSGCSAETLLVLRRTGTSHLLSISGFHVGIAAAMAMALSARLTRLSGIVRRAGLQSPIPLAAALIAAWSYTALAGWVLPAERAAVMLSAGLVARALGRGVAALPVLVLTGAALSVTDPGAPGSASFQLSFGAMAGLILFVPRLTARLPDRLPGPIRFVCEGLATTLGATIGTLPVSALWFQEVAPAAPVANLVSMPVLGVALVPVGAVVCAAPEPLSSWVAALATLACRLELWMLGALVFEPLRPAVGVWGALLLSLCALASLRRPLLASIAAAIVLCSPRRPQGDLTLTVLDVGQGDAMLVERGRQRWLVDGGRDGRAVARWLRRSGIRRLDVAVATHPDLDHAGGLVDVLEAIEVGELWAFDAPQALLDAASRRNVPVVRPPPGSGALHPPAAGLEDLADNDRSIVFGLGPLLLTGDLERRGEELLLPQIHRPYDVLKVGHHGSRTSTSEDWLEVVRPRLAIVSVGENRYGHPHSEVLERLQARGITVLRTDIDGTITLQQRGERLYLYTAAGRRGEMSISSGPSGSAGAL